MPYLAAQRCHLGPWKGKDLDPTLIVRDILRDKWFPIQRFPCVWCEDWSSQGHRPTRMFSTSVESNGRFLETQAAQSITYLVQKALLMEMALTTPFNYLFNWPTLVSHRSDKA